MGTTQIVDTVAQDATTTAVGALAGQIEGVHAAVHAITSAVFPAGNEGASIQATSQQQLSTQEFSVQLQAGLAEMTKAALLSNASSKATQVTDAATAALQHAVQA